MSKIIIAGLPIGGLSSGEATSRLTRSIRACWPALPSEHIVQLPLADGGEGTIDLLVTQSLGSFLEVEATSATGEPVVVPLGFAGEDGKLAIIEMQRVARSNEQRGTSYGVGELILDALDEGAFSVLLGHDEPLAGDAGLGAAAALGVKFFDSSGHELNMKDPASALSQVARIDATGRAFEILSSRFYIARSAKTLGTLPSEELRTELLRLSEIIRRDTGIPVSTEHLSASAVEFGLIAFCGAEVRDGMSLVIEATGVETMMKRGEIGTFILIAESPQAISADAVKNVLESASTSGARIILIVSHNPTAAEKKKLPARVTIRSLADARLFAAPIGVDAAMDAIRRDTLLRIEKIAPELGITE
ncbi:MAG: glycerate kinase [Bacteroidota bacterium]|nr:glycerate kinase [Bacteroidota bacterium]MDP4232836.1 glycerate kinase [Bacteroidota bacterium]MDP4241880.1 glycerate kinase [Bacteroidota bacterium]MDP4288205.1 glycerate kinase [Bacteroidota bacterium]